MVLEAAVDLVYIEGLGLGTEAITYARVFRHLEQTTGEKVTRASVHERIWTDQADFQAALRARLASFVPNIEVEESKAFIRSVIEASLETTSVRETVRAVVQGLALIDEGVDDEHPYRAQTTIRGLMLSATPEELSANPEITAAVVGSLVRQADMYEAMYTEALDAVGLHVRPELGLSEKEAIRLFTRLLNTMSDGVGLRERFDAEPIKDISVAFDGIAAEWNLVGVVGWALMNQFFLMPEPV